MTNYSRSLANGMQRDSATVGLFFPLMKQSQRRERQTTKSKTNNLNTYGCYSL